MTDSEEHEVQDRPDGPRSVATPSDGHNERPRELTPGLKVLVVLGATATGKTGLSLQLAREFNGEVVNADSRYLYRGMDIGTAKPTPAERAGIPHHLIDIREPDEAYSLAAFMDDIYPTIEEVAARGRLPIIAGGTPQYLRAMLEGWTVPRVAPDEQLRARLESEDTAVLYDQLLAVDPASAERTGPTNKRRIIRALEVWHGTGRPMSASRLADPPPYHFLTIGLRQPRERLYARIDDRVRAMYAAGWMDEIRSLRERGITAEMPSMSAHGYREALAVVNGELDIDEAIRRTQVIIHRYVRHQETWFRKFPDVCWFDSTEPGFEQRAITAVREHLARS